MQPDRVILTQFHPSYNYEDFVRGLKSETEGGTVRYVAKHGVFGQACQLAERAADAPCVLIIDEINRANVAAVFGELLYGLEYRGSPVVTSYTVDGDSTLTVPENLLVIGTMNTADRSIGHIDYAVRRRFAFVACAPDRGVVEAHPFAEPKDRALALQMFDAVADLFTPEERRCSRPGTTRMISGSGTPTSSASTSTARACGAGSGIRSSRSCGSISPTVSSSRRRKQWSTLWPVQFGG